MSATTPTVCRGELRRFTVWLSWLLRTGVPLIDALELVACRAEGCLAGVASELAADVRAQRLLADSLDLHSDLFPRAYRDTVAIAEYAGTLDLAFAELASSL
jgi:type II secretory pathway component PulF